MEVLNTHLQSDDKVVYAVFGREVCPDTQKEHLQGYVYFENAVTGGGLHKRLGLNHGEYRGEAQRGTAEQAADYCKKDGDVALVIGTVPDPADAPASALSLIHI